MYPCQFCSGTGRDLDNDAMSCPDCNGTGSQPMQQMPPPRFE